MSTVTVHNAAGIDYDAYIEAVKDAGFGVASAPIVENPSPAQGDDTITITLAGGRTLILFGEFSGSTVSDGSGPIYKFQFRTNNVPDLTGAWAAVQRFGLEDLRSAIISDFLFGGTAVKDLLTQDPILFNGNNGADVMFGGDANDTMNGGAGNDDLSSSGGIDNLNGGAGADTMTGGDGNDRYFVDNAGDVVIETVANLATGGNDTVFSQIAYTLGANVEILRLQGTGNLSGTGNALNNNISGTTGANLLQGLAGNDVLIGNDGTDTLAGGAGNDTLTGGSQADVFRFTTANAGADLITDFNKNADRFDLGGGSFTQLTIASDGDVILKHNGGTIRIDAPLHNLTLAQYNALVLPSGGASEHSSGGVFAQDALAISPHLGIFGHPDFLYA